MIQDDGRWAPLGRTIGPSGTPARIQDDGIWIHDDMGWDMDLVACARSLPHEADPAAGEGPPPAAPPGSGVVADDSRTSGRVAEAVTLRGSLPPARLWVGDGDAGALIPGVDGQLMLRPALANGRPDPTILFEVAAVRSDDLAAEDLLSEVAGSDGGPVPDNGRQPRVGPRFGLIGPVGEGARTARGQHWESVVSEGAGAGTVVWQSCWCLEVGARIYVVRETVRGADRMATRETLQAAAGWFRACRAAIRVR